MLKRLDIDRAVICFTLPLKWLCCTRSCLRFLDCGTYEQSCLCSFLGSLQLRARLAATAERSAHDSSHFADDQRSGGSWHGARAGSGVMR